MTRRQRIIKVRLLTPRIAAALAALAAVAPCVRADPLPTSLFAREAAIREVKLSRDGQYLGFVAGVGEGQAHHTLVLLNLTTGAKSVLNPPPVWSDDDHTEEVRNFYWLTNTRLAFTYGRPNQWLPMPGIGAVDRDGGRWRDLPFYGGIFFCSGDSESFLVLHAIGSRFRDQPDVYEIDTRPRRTGLNDPQITAPVTGRDFHLIADNNTEVNHWIPDMDGDVRVGVAFDGDNTRVFWRDDDDAPWVQLHDFDAHGLGGYPVGIDFDRRTAYVAALTNYGTWGVAAYDLAARRRGKLLAADPVYDILSPTDYIAGRAYLRFSRKKQRLVGISYPTEVRKTLWLDPEFAQVQASIDQTFPGSINHLDAWSDDESKIVISSSTDRRPTTFYLLNRTTRKLRKLFDTAPWINPALMGRTLPIAFKARDGLVIHGYLTLAANSGGKNLPLVVVPQASLILTRAAEGFDPEAQFLCSRGYAVLRVNTRGTPGYGKAFYEAGRRQAGGAIQNDITDGVRWTIAHGYVDRSRIAIVGTAFGGFSAEWALENEPGLYRCGVANQAVCDWQAYLTSLDDTLPLLKKPGYGWHSELFRYLSAEVGDPYTEADLLREISPVNHVEKLGVPVLVVSHEREYQILHNQSDLFIDALKRRNAAYEYKAFPKTTNNLDARRELEEYYDLVASFLDRNMK